MIINPFFVRGMLSCAYDVINLQHAVVKCLAQLTETQTKRLYKVFGAIWGGYPTPSTLVGYNKIQFLLISVSIFCSVSRS